MTQTYATLRLFSSALTVFLIAITISPSIQADVLYIGDSQTHGFLGDHMNEYFRAQTDLSLILGVSASSPRHWVGHPASKTSTWLCRQNGRWNTRVDASMQDHICKFRSSGESALQYLLRTRNPKHVVFQFLGNSTHISAESLKRYATELAHQLDSDTTCTFITSPPNHIDKVENNKRRWRTQRIFVESLQTRCRFILGMSEEMIRTFATRADYYWPDKAHMNRQGAQVFFKYVIKNLEALDTP